MPTRNTPVLKQIIDPLDDLLVSEPHALGRLENHFKHSLVVVAGDIKLVAAQAVELRLAITTAECSLVLDYLQIGITIEQTEEAINKLFADRFVEPEQFQDQRLLSEWALFFSCDGVNWLQLNLS